MVSCPISLPRPENKAANVGLVRRSVHEIYGIFGMDHLFLSMSMNRGRVANSSAGVQDRLGFY